jgi:hypothetical protein
LPYAWIGKSLLVVLSPDLNAVAPVARIPAPYHSYTRQFSERPLSFHMNAQALRHDFHHVKREIR